VVPVVPVVTTLIFKDFFGTTGLKWGWFQHPSGGDNIDFLGNFRFAAPALEVSR
jgi:hypothetical protein